MESVASLVHRLPHGSLRHAIKLKRFPNRHLIPSLSFFGSSFPPSRTLPRIAPQPPIPFSHRLVIPLPSLSLSSWVPLESVQGSVLRLSSGETARPSHHAGPSLFKNPWSSYIDQTPFQIVSKLLFSEQEVLTIKTGTSGASLSSSSVGSISTSHMSSAAVHGHQVSFFGALPPPIASTPIQWDAIEKPLEDLQATWLGHVTFLIQMRLGGGVGGTDEEQAGVKNSSSSTGGGSSGVVNILTDPVFSDRCSPFQWSGPKRYTPPACAIADLPPIHVVLISHNHYDHMDEMSVKALLEKERKLLQMQEKGGEHGRREARKVSNIATARGAESSSSSSSSYSGTLFVVPLGLRPLLLEWGVSSSRIQELDWWEAFTPFAPSNSAAAAAGLIMDSCAAAGFHSSHWKSIASHEPGAAGLFIESKIKVGGGGPINVENVGIPYRLYEEHLASFQEATSSSATSSSSSSSNTTASVSSASPSSISIIAIPAQHQSARLPWDRNETLWCGFAVIGPERTRLNNSSSNNKTMPITLIASGVGSGSPLSPSSSSSTSTYRPRFFFSGDTGYRSAAHSQSPTCPVFPAVGRTLGPFDLALLPIGAYYPETVMKPFHASPEDAVDMHRDVQSRKSIGMHWGTFPLTREPTLEPPLRLARAREAAKLQQEDFLAVHVGTTVGATSNTSSSHIF